MIGTSDRDRRISMIGAVAQLTLVGGIFLSRFGNPDLDFLTGFLIGFSLVGNLAFLASIGKKQSKNNHNGDKLE